MVNVTFNVDMSDESFQTVFIASDFNNWREVEMQPSVDSIYSYTIQLENNTNYEYKFIKLNDGLKTWEPISPPHAVNYQFWNRLVEVGEVDINLPALHYGRFD
jgi:1,4-alpha-glucan branching enzyme